MSWKHFLKTRGILFGDLERVRKSRIYQSLKIKYLYSDQYGILVARTFDLFDVDDSSDLIHVHKTHQEELSY